MSGLNRTDALLTLFDSLSIAGRQLLRHPHKPGARTLLREQLDQAEATVRAIRADMRAPAPAAEAPADAEGEDPRPEPPPHGEAEVRIVTPEVTAAGAPDYYWNRD